MLRNLLSEWFATQLSSGFLLPLAAYLLADIWIHFACWVPVLLALYLNWGALELKKFWNIEDLEVILHCFPLILREHARILVFCMQSWARKLSVLFVFVGGSRFFYVFPCRWFMLVTWFVDVTNDGELSRDEIILADPMTYHPLMCFCCSLLVLHWSILGVKPHPTLMKSWGCCWL